MKELRIISVIAIAFLCFAFSTGLYAQSVEHTRGEDVYGILLDSIKYYLPEFTRATIYYKDGTHSIGKVNVATYNQKVHFMDGTGTVKELALSDDVERVVAGDAVLIKGKSYFHQLTVHSSSNPDIWLAVSQELVFLDTDRPGAYGTASPTSATTTYTSVDYNGQSYETSVNQNTKYRYKRIIYLYSPKGFILASRKNLMKLFPQKAKEIDAWCKSNKADFDNYRQVKEYFITL